MIANSVLRGKIYRLLQFIVVVCFLVVPFIKTPNGNSLFRFDISTLQLHAFNSVVNFTSFFSAFIAILLFTFLFVFVTQLMGRVWCGWLCPQSFFSIRIESYSKKFKNKTISKVVSILLSFFFALVLTLNWMMYFVSPYNFISSLQSSNTMLIIGIVLFLFIFVDFVLVRFKWCKYVCPYSKFQVVMTDDDTLYVGMIPGKEVECIDCKACIRVCPTHIDPRKNPDADCIYCETCVTACNQVFQKKDHHEGILGYVWGKSNKINIKRPNLILTFLVSVVLFVVLVYSIVSTSEPFVISVSDNVKSLGDGVYSVQIEMKSNLDKAVRVHFSNPDNVAKISPEGIRVFLKANVKDRLTINTLKEIPDGKIKIKAVYDREQEPIILEVKLK